MMNFRWKVQNYIFIEIYVFLIFICLMIQNDPVLLESSNSKCADPHPKANFTYNNIHIIYDNNIEKHDIEMFLLSHNIPPLKQLTFLNSYCVCEGWKCSEAQGKYFYNKIWIYWWYDRESTFKHEYGHWVWFNKLTPSQRYKYCNNFRKLGYDNISEYSNKNCRENFAENWEHDTDKITMYK